MKQRFRVIVIALLLISLTLGGCTRIVSKSPKDGKIDLSADSQPRSVLPTNNHISQPQYFFINHSLLGSYDDDGWHSLCDIDNQTDGGRKTFYAQDLLKQNSYYVYDGNGLRGESKQIVWTTGEGGLGSFEDEGTAKKLAPYGELYEPVAGDSSLPRIFNIPIAAGQELSDLKIPDYSFFTKFIVNNENTSKFELVTNRAIQPYPREFNDGLEATTGGIQRLNDLFRENHMENTVANFIKCLSGDFDNDGYNEYLMLAQAPRSDSGYPLLYGDGKTDHLGVYTVAFYQDDKNNIQMLYGDWRPYQGVFTANQDKNMQLMGDPQYCIGIDLLMAADLNSDGVYEIGVKKSEWEYISYLIYAMNDQGEYEVVMRSNLGT